MLPSRWIQEACRNIDTKMARYTFLWGKNGFELPVWRNSAPPHSLASASDIGRPCVTSHGTAAWWNRNTVSWHVGPQSRGDASRWSIDGLATARNGAGS